MKNFSKSFLLFLSILTLSVANAQIKPHEAVALMMRGINIGNTMEPEYEGQWGNSKIVETLFDDYKAAGFTSIRIPIRWDKHTLTVSPYTIDAAWINRVEQVVDWGLSKGLFITINAHHEEWIKTKYADSTQRARFDSIWSQISTRFQGKSDRLLFEIINEPKGLTQIQINDMNARVLKIIRKTNPVRLVVFSGHEWSAAEQLLSAAIPDTSDKYLVGYFHSYDPWPFGLQGPGTYGSSADIYATKSRFDKVAAWSVKNNIPVILSEFGAIKKCEYNSRMYCYATVVEQSINHGVAFNAWDDGGDFQIMLRPSRKWNDIKDILMYTYKESPTKLKLVLVKNTNIMFTWTNRTNLNDSIIIDRKTSSTSAFTKIATVAPGASSYYDSLLTPNKDYYYRLRSNIKDSIQIYSYPITIKTNLSTSINTFENRGVFLIYPNPANSRISIKSSNAAPNTTLEVYDILGKLTTRLSIHGNEAEIPLTSYNPGVYFFRLSNNSGTEIYKVILQ